MMYHEQTKPTIHFILRHTAPNSNLHGNDLEMRVSPKSYLLFLFSLFPRLLLRLLLLQLAPQQAFPPIKDLSQG